MNKMKTTNEFPDKIYLTADEIPKAWYNLRADMDKKPAPLINPATGDPVTLEELTCIFTEEGAKQELDETTKFIPIPEEIQNQYRKFRPAPLVRAADFEKAIGTSAKIYYKFEGNNTSGSHKLNSAIAQAYYAKKEGLTHLTTETGAGQWGTALAMSCEKMGLDLTVYMVKCSYEQKPFRREIMKTFGGRVVPSPSMETEAGKKILSENPDNPGSLGVAISEAVETAVTTPSTKYVLGSVLNQVLLHQTIIGLETQVAMKKYGIKPDVIVGCAGGGSNLGGFMAPFLGEQLRGEEHYKFIAAESASCPSLTKGEFKYDYCDTGRVTPMAKMYTMGYDYIPPSNHAGGLRYHGMSPILSEIYHQGLMEAYAYEQHDVFEANTIFARAEGILPAPESGHAIKAVIDEATKFPASKTDTTGPLIVFCLSGTGFFDMVAYGKYNNGEL
ncbi:TrpB-like pyridoxal phosphate-dependent enzyme [Anaerovoracaceae bacterium SGI.195]